jgi:tRNA(fMet)-specific endonuclease VapC
MEVKYMLDTNICIYILNKRPMGVLQKLIELGDAKVYLSSVVVAELYYGAAKSQTPEKNRIRLQEFLLDFLLLPLGVKAGILAGKIRADLEQQGTPIGIYDCLIAAHALEQEATLVTNNTKEFLRVKGLELENWFA